MELSKNPNAAMQEMMDTITNLRNLYRRETELLEAADIKAFLEMQAEKIRIATRYEDQISQMIDRREEMKSANPLLKKRMEDMHNNFSDLTAKNLDAIGRMKRTADRLGNTIRYAARDAAVKQRAFSYGETGTFKGSEKKVISTGVSETA